MALDGASEAAISAQVAKAGSWGLAGRTVLLLANLAATPFTIRLLGPAAYGLWALIQTILLWASVADGGMWAATTKYGAEHYAAGDSAGESEVIWSGFCFAFTTTAAVALALALGAHFLLGLLHAGDSLLGAGTWALRLACAGFVVSSVVGTVNTAQQVRLRWKQYTMFNTLANLFGAIGVPVALYAFSGGVVTAAAVGLIGALFYFVGLSWDALRVLPALRHPKVNLVMLRRLAAYGGALTLASLASVAVTSGERFFLAANASTTEVAYYAVAMTVATTLQILPEQLTSPLMPALARLEAEGKLDEHSSLYGKSISGLFLVVTPLAIVTALVAKPFLSLWAGAAYGLHGTALLLIALGGVWANSLAWVPGAYLLSADKTSLLAWVQGAEILPYLAAAWVLTAQFGALGAVVAWSGRYVVDSVVQFAVVRRTARLPIVPLSAHRARSALAPGLLAATCLGAATLSQSLATRAALASGLLVAYGAGIWWLVFTAQERRGVTRLLHEVLGRDVSPQQSRPCNPTDCA